MACSTQIYNWTLGNETPSIVTLPDDLWPGDAEHGRWICQSAITFDDISMPLEKDFWNTAPKNEASFFYLHNFQWLRDLRALGNDQARQKSRQLVESWIENYPAWDEASWHVGIIGRRLSNWLVHYSFFAQSADESFQHMLLNSVQKQAKHLSRFLSGNPKGFDVISAAQGLVYAGIALSGRENWLDQGLQILKVQIESQILNDGGHISRSPHQTFRILRLCFEISAALAKAGYPVPAPVQHAIDRMIPALRFFRHGDKKMVVFNGTLELTEEAIESVLAKGDTRIRVPKSLYASGFERVTHGRSLLVINTGKVPPKPYDREVHAAPLAFEFSYGRDRIFVNCGAHASDPDWQSLLRVTAAHNCLVMDDKNAFDIDNDGHLGRRTGNVKATRLNHEHGTLIQTEHHGYESLNSLVHKRTFFLNAEGNDLRGEDLVEGELMPGRYVTIQIRFHIHPRVLVSLVKQNTEALLRTPGGIGWRFMQEGGELALENSIYLGENGTPRKTKQIVIRTFINSEYKKMNWGLIKESL